MDSVIRHVLMTHGITANGGMHSVPEMSSVWQIVISVLELNCCVNH